MILKENPKLNQKNISEILFNDYASMTRMIELMVKKGYLVRTSNKEDRRSTILSLTEKGEGSIELLTPIIELNRFNALNGLTESERVNFQKE